MQVITYPRCHEYRRVRYIPYVKPRGLSRAVQLTTTRDVIVLPNQTTAWLLRALLTFGYLQNHLWLTFSMMLMIGSYGVALQG